MANVVIGVAVIVLLALGGASWEREKRAHERQRERDTWGD